MIVRHGVSLAIAVHKGAYRAAIAPTAVRIERSEIALKQ